MTTRNSAKAEYPKEYRAWNNMRSRCRNPNVPCYPSYGGRGVKVCERWDSFANFFADMGAAPSPAHTVDRIDGDGDYEPGNCRWATRAEQSNNLRSNILVEINGIKRTVAVWARHYGVKLDAAYHRIASGWEPHIAVSAPLGSYSNKRKEHAPL
jgi:hypothetical protein